MRIRGILFLPALAALGGLLALVSACEDEDLFGDVVCEANGVTYKAGDSFPAPDGSGTCRCESYGPPYCPGSSGGTTGGRCSYGGLSRPAGSTFASTDGCNSCTCESDGTVACTDRACGGAGTCAVDGGTVSEGFSFPSPDGCNTCTCGANGAVGCTKIACPPRDAGGDAASDAETPDAG